MEKELEKIINKTNERLSKRPFRGDEDKIESFVEIVFRDDIKYAEFQGEFGRRARSIKELKPLLDYLDKNGYKTNLD